MQTGVEWGGVGGVQLSMWRGFIIVPEVSGDDLMNYCWSMKLRRDGTESASNKGGISTACT
jgi:hypothetical protein